MEYRNAAYSSPTSIDMEIEHPVFGWIPFTATSDDVEENGRLLFEAARGATTPWVEPEPGPQEFPALTAKKFWKAAALMGVTEETVLALVNQIEDPVERLTLSVDIRRSETFWRTDPLIAYFAPLVGLSDTEIDTMWLWAADL
jgi:hypothetical protein